MSRRLLSSWNEIAEARLQLLQCARHEIAIFDRDLSRFRLDQPDRLEALKSFLTRSPRNRLRIVLHDAQPSRAGHGRFWDLLKSYAHLMTIRESPTDLKMLPDQMLIVDSANAAIQFQFDQARAKLLCEEAEEIRPYLRRFDELWELCDPPLSSAHLGL